MEMEDPWPVACQTLRAAPHCVVYTLHAMRTNTNDNEQRRCFCNLTLADASVLVWDWLLPYPTH